MGVVRRRQLKRSSLSRGRLLKKVVSFSRKNRVTPSVAAAGDTNPSDATANCCPTGRETALSDCCLVFCTQGRIYFQQGPVQKNVEPFTWGDRPYFSWKNLVTFLVITVGVSAVSSSEKLATFFYSPLSFTWGSPIISGMQKFAAPFVRAPFCGSPCSAEHAEHA